MPPLTIYKADQGYFVAPKSPDLEHAMWGRVSAYFKTKRDAEAEANALFAEFQKTGVYPPPVAHAG